MNLKIILAFFTFLYLMFFSQSYAKEGVVFSLQGNYNYPTERTYTITNELDQAYKYKLNNSKTIVSPKIALGYEINLNNRESIILETFWMQKKYTYDIGSKTSNSVFEFNEKIVQNLIGVSLAYVIMPIDNLYFSAGLDVHYNINKSTFVLNNTISSSNNNGFNVALMGAIDYEIIEYVKLGLVYNGFLSSLNNHSMKAKYSQITNNFMSNFNIKRSNSIDSSVSIRLQYMWPPRA